MNENVKAAVETILKELNTISGRSRDEVASTILATLQNEHRTIQQSFWSVVLMAQCEYAKSSCDMRNEASVRLAEEVRNMVRESGRDVAGLPYI